MINELIQIFWLFLPAGIANMAPVLFKWVPILDYPIDIGGKISGKRILGNNKTFRGLIFGILIAMLVVYLQSLADFETIINYSAINILLLGFLMGFGVIFGDSVKSFFKRRRGIKSGKSWLVFDQVDWIFGAIIFVNLYVWVGWKVNFISLVLFALLHPVVNYAGYLLKIKKNKW